MTAKVIALEGPDRVGKFTQATMLVNKLRSIGYTVGFYEVPAKDFLTYPIIYWMLKNGLAKRFPRLFQWLQIQNRRKLQKKILSSIGSHDYIILDRWFLSTYIYGKASGIELNLDDLRLGLLPPDMNIILNGKIGGLEARDVYEKDDVMQAKVVKFYREWARSHANDAILIEATQPRELVHAQIWRQLISLGLIQSLRLEKKK